MNFWYKNKNGNVVLRVRIAPNSSCLRIIEINDDYIKIGVCSVPEKGKANGELIKFLSKKLKLPKKNFSIIKGLLDKNKQIEILDLENMEALYDY
ncbi:MAG: DUF167 family protein [Alphaproteobacteria bacterium]